MLLLGGGSSAQPDAPPRTRDQEPAEATPPLEPRPAGLPANTPETAEAGPLAALQARYERVRDLRARFEQRSRIASLGREETSTGRLLVRRPGRMRWEYSEPSAHVLTIDGETVRMYLPSERQLQIAALDPASFSPTALSFLLGEGDLRSEFTHERIEDAERPELGLKLQPRGDASFEHLEVWLDPGTQELRESVLVDLFGNRTSVRFSDMVENAGLPPGAFEIELAPGTEIIDLR